MKAAGASNIGRTPCLGGPLIAESRDFRAGATTEENRGAGPSACGVGRQAGN
jgi:hypothetical protein